MIPSATMSPDTLGVLVALFIIIVLFAAGLALHYAG